MNQHTLKKLAIRVCSLNVNHSNAATHAAMHYISSQKEPPFDIILIQEPWWQEINSTFTTVSLAGWQVTLPKPTIPQDEQPRTTTYHRLRVGINLTLRTNIAQDLDYMILNIKREGATWPPITLINICNQKTPHSNTNSIHEWTAD